MFLLLLWFLICCFRLRLLSVFLTCSFVFIIFPHLITSDFFFQILQPFYICWFSSFHRFFPYENLFGFLLHFCPTATSSTILVFVFPLFRSFFCLSVTENMRIAGNKLQTQEKGTRAEERRRVMAYCNLVWRSDYGLSLLLFSLRTNIWNNLHRCTPLCTVDPLLLFLFHFILLFTFEAAVVGIMALLMVNTALSASDILSY